MEADIPDDNQVFAERRAKLAALRARGPAFPNDFTRTHLAAALHGQYDGQTLEALEQQPVTVAVAGRLMLKRLMGKASFATLQDGSGRLQLFVNDEDAGAAAHEDFRHWDIGDIVAATGTLFKTRRGELSVRCRGLRLLAKALRPLPDKFHGLADQEQRHRQRYVDLIVNESTRRTFEIRAPHRRRRAPVPGRARLPRGRDADAARRSRAARRPSRSSRTTMRSTWTCTCASRPSSISSAWSSAASSASSRSTATSATKASARGTIPNSRCSSSTRPTTKCAG